MTKGSGKMGSWLVFLLLLVLPRCLPAATTPLYFKEGAELRLNPSISEGIWAITWKLDSNLVSEWVKDKLDLVYYRTFRGRSTLNITSGELEIRNATKGDAGKFTLELNNRVLQDVYRTQMIEEVPKPTVRVAPLSCGPESEKCTLSCVGNTENVGPVSYLWRLGDGEWEDESKDITVNNTDIIQKVEKFSCQLKNPVSQKWSDPLPNPLFLPPPSRLHWVAFVVLGVMVVLFLVGFAIWKFFIRKTRGQNLEITPMEGKPLNHQALTPEGEGSEKAET